MPPEIFLFFLGALVLLLETKHCDSFHFSLELSFFLISYFIKITGEQLSFIASSYRGSQEVTQKHNSFDLREAAQPQAFAPFLAGSVWVTVDGLLSTEKGIEKLT